MWIRVSGGRQYVDIVEYRRWGGRQRCRVLLSLGRCADRARQCEMREIIRDYRPMEHARIVLEELNDASGRLQGRGFFKRMRSWG